jgi:hypothetical protein
MEVYVDPGTAACVEAQLAALTATHCAPFAALVADYAAVSRHCRELEVLCVVVCVLGGAVGKGASSGVECRTHALCDCTQRLRACVYASKRNQHAPNTTKHQNKKQKVRVAQLDKEAAELRDEAAALTTRLRAHDAGAAREFAAKAEGYRVALSKAQAELAAAYREKGTVSAALVLRFGGRVEQYTIQQMSQADVFLKACAVPTHSPSTIPLPIQKRQQNQKKALEDLIAAQRARDAALAESVQARSDAAARSDEIAALKRKLAELAAALDAETGARALAAAEAEARYVHIFV